jgi:hypothetical protein
MRGFPVLSIVGSLFCLSAAQEYDGPLWPCPFPNAIDVQQLQRPNLLGLALHWKWATGILNCPLLSSLTVQFIADFNHLRTISIRHKDGSYETVAKILGSEPYVSLMQELTQPANFTPDDKRIPDDMSWQDWALWRAKRRMNKMWANH